MSKLTGGPADEGRVWQILYWARHQTTMSHPVSWPSFYCFFVGCREQFLGDFRTSQSWNLYELCLIEDFSSSKVSFPICFSPAAPFEGWTVLSICSQISVLSSSYEEHPRSPVGGRLGSPFRNSLLCCANHILSTFYILFLGAKYKES